MANQFQVLGMVGQKALARFINHLGFTMQVTNPYEGEFGVAGRKIGNTYNIRLPVNFIGGNGPTISPEDIVEQVTPLVINAQINVSWLAYSSEELLYMDDHMRRYVYPAIDTLADKFDRIGMALFPQVYNMVGTPGVSIRSVYNNAGGGDAGRVAVENLYLDAGALLSNMATPMDDRVAILNPTQQAGTVSALSGLFNPQNRIGTQYKTAQMTQALGFDFGWDQNVPQFVTGGSTTAVTVNGANQTGNSVILTGLTGTLNPGDVLTFAGTDSVNPKNYQDFGSLFQATPTASVTGTGGSVTVSITPPINPALGVAQTVTASPANGAVVTINNGAAIGVRSPQALLFAPDAFTWASPDLPHISGGVVACRVVKDDQTGLSIRMITTYDGVHDQLITRCDMLVGWALQRPQRVVRLAT